MTSCLDLRDHIVQLYADEYLQQQGATLAPLERAAFVGGWAEELAKRGTFERFEATCAASLTPSNYRCGMSATTPDGLVNCMHLSDAR